MDETEYDVLEPVLDEYGTPCWLTRKYVKTSTTSKKTSTTDTNTPIKEVIENDKPLVEVAVFELKPEGLWHCQKCGANITFIEGKPAYCTECDRNSDFRLVTEIITGDIENLWKLTKWRDIPQDDLNMLEVFDSMMDLSKQCLIFPEEILYKIFSLSIIATYHINIWESVGWLSFIGLHDSGKTRAIDFISELGYRLVHGGSGVSFPAMVRASHYYGAGILLDQAETKMNANTETGRELLAFVLPSYRRRSKYIVADNENQKKTIAYNNFGFKSFASERAFNPALTSRCIPFYMERDYPEIAKLSFIQNDLDILQNKLLNYKLKYMPPDELENSFELKGRIREIFEPIIATGRHIGVDVGDIIKYAQDMEKEKEEELQGTREYEILKVIKNTEENPSLFDAIEDLSYDNICDSIGWEYNKKNAQRLGYIFKKKLLLKTKTKTEGTVVLLNDTKNTRRLMYLYRRYHV